jgi:hypothetical protein
MRRILHLSGVHDGEVAAVSNPTSREVPLRAELDDDRDALHPSHDIDTIQLVAPSWYRLDTR